MGQNGAAPTIPQPVKRRCTVYYLGTFLFALIAILVVVAFLKVRSRSGKFDD